MQSVVITGSSRGIGRGLALAFLQRGCRVMLNGRNPEVLSKTAEELGAITDHARVGSCKGDVTHVADLERLWTAAARRFGRVDIWINNAGVGHPADRLWELPIETVERVLDIDYRATVLGTRVAITRMLEQGSGHVYLMEGFGSTGMMRPGLTVYGSTKYAVRYLTRSIARELRGTPVRISAISPGMVATEFISDQYAGREEEFDRVKPIFNLIADRVETVAPWIVGRILRNSRSGNSITWLTRAKTLARFLFGWIRKRNVFSDG